MYRSENKSYNMRPSLIAKNKIIAGCVMVIYSLVKLLFCNPKNREKINIILMVPFPLSFSCMYNVYPHTHKKNKHFGSSKMERRN